MTDLQKEIRQILMGYLNYDGKDLVAGKGIFSRLSGPPSGIQSARIFGILDTRRQYALPEGDKNWVKKCREAFYQMGRTVKLANDPEAETVLFMPLLYNPSLLKIEFEEDVMYLTVYTARTPATYLNAFHAFRAWEKRMPERLESQLLPREKALKKKQKKEKKKQAKEEKHREKRTKRFSGFVNAVNPSKLMRDAEAILNEPKEAPQQKKPAEEKKPSGPRHGK